MLPFIQDNTPIILDLSDIAKTLTKKVDYLATVRDGIVNFLDFAELAENWKR